MDMELWSLLPSDASDDVHYVLMNFLVDLTAAIEVYYLDAGNETNIRRCLPDEIKDDDALALVTFLSNLSNSVENHYYVQLKRALSRYGMPSLLGDSIE